MRHMNANICTKVTSRTVKKARTNIYIYCTQGRVEGNKALDIGCLSSS
jgi:hypothetical protein